jgi:hypothetical protein
MEVLAERRSSADQLQHMEHLRSQHSTLLAELEAARALVERGQPPAEQPAAVQRQPLPQPPLVQHQPQVVTQLTQPPAAQQPPRQRRSGSKNYSNEELMSLLRTIQRVLPICPEMWDMVAQLHAMSYSNCQRDGKSLKTKYLRLANEKPGTGNPTMSDSTHLAKEIKVAIDLKVGNTPANADDFFGGDGDDSSQSSPAAGAAPPAASPAVAPPTAAASVPLVITATTAATNNVTAITNATTGTKKKTRTNQIVSAVDSNTNFTKSSFSSLMEQRLQAEESELRLRRMEREVAEEQHRLDRQEERWRREEMEEARRQEREERRLEREEERKAREEADERRRREREEERNFQQQQLMMMMQVIMSGAMAFMGMKSQNNNNNNN